MKICLITRPDLLPPTHGAAAKIVRTAEALSQLGAEVFVVTNDRVWFLRAERGQLVRVRYPQVLLSATNVPPPIKERLLKAGLPSVWHLIRKSLDLLGYPRDEHFLYQPLLDLDFLIRVLYVGWTHACEVFQAEFPGYAAPALVAAKVLGGKAILAEHNVEHLRLKTLAHLPEDVHTRVRGIELGLARRMDHVITCSDVDRTLLIQDGVPEERITTIPHGVDLPNYEALLNPGPRQENRRKIRALYRLPPDCTLLVFHGTLHYHPNTVAVKRIAESVLPGLQSRGHHVKVLIPGMNPPTWYAHPDIIYPGMVQDLAEHLAAADMAVVPLEDGGGTRLKILEYFAARLPVVSTYKGAEGIPARDGTELRLTRDMAELVAATSHLLNHPGEAEDLALGGRRFVEAYSWEEIARRHLQVYAGQRPDVFRLPTPLEKVKPDPAPGRDPIHSVVDHIPVKLHPTKPQTLIIMLNRGCNLRCDFCDLYERPQYLAEDKVLKILQDAAEMGTRTVVFTGGEPTLHPGLFRLIRAARDLGLGTNITTNGTTLERHLDKILASGLDSLSVSLDGLKNTHETLRRVEGCFDATLAGVRRLKDAGFPHINIYFVITGQNVSELVPVWNLARELGCGFDFWPVNDAHHLYVVSPEARMAYREAINTIAEADPAVAARRDYYMAGLDYHAGWDKRVRCLGLIEQAGVNIDGELVPCCVWDNKDLTVGSLVEEGAASLSELWYGEKAHQRRREIFEKGCHNRCFNHSLYEFQSATGLSFVVGEGVTPRAPSAPPPRREPPPYLPGSYMVVELANGCNLKCVHCAQADENHPHYRKTGYFPPEGLRALVDDLLMTGARFDTLILFWLGEPTLHPQFVQIYQDLLHRIVRGEDGICRPFGKIEVHTNATLLTRKMSEAILNDESIPQRWHFTLDAAHPHTYLKIKGADLLEKAEANVRQFYQLKGERKSRWPHTALQYIVSDRNEGEVGTFIDRWQTHLMRSGLKPGLCAGHVPDVFDTDFVFLRALDCPTPDEQTRQNQVYRRVLKQHGLKEQTPPEVLNPVKAHNLSPCSGFWKTPVIGFDGNLTPCTRDSEGHNLIGNVLSVPFSKLWWGDHRLNSWREQVARGDYGGRQICQTCFIPQSVNYTDISLEEIRETRQWETRPVDSLSEGL